MPRKILIFFLLVAFPTLGLSQEGEFIGSDRCRICHEKAYALWSQSPHAKAQARLSASEQKELRCLFCHATDARKNLSRFQFSDVQCEACHGPGRQHLERMVSAEAGGEKRTSGLLDLSEAVCRDCHSDSRSPSLSEFEYQKSLAKIRHW